MKKCIYLYVYAVKYLSYSPNFHQIRQFLYSFQLFYPHKGIINENSFKSFY